MNQLESQAVPETYTHGTWVVKAGEEDAFVDAWRQFVTWATTMDGSGTFRLVRDVDRPDRFMSFAPWDTFEAQNAWKRLPEFREQIGRVRAHCEDFEPSVFELVTVVE